MVLHRLRHGAENHADFGKLFLEGSDDGHTVEHSIYRHARKHLLLSERNTELLVSLKQPRVYFIEALETNFLLRCRIVVGILKVDRRIGDLCPCRLCHGEPAAEGVQTPFQQPFGFILFRGDETNRILR